MDELNRRKFLQLVGAGSGVMAAGLVVPPSSVLRLMDSTVGPSSTAGAPFTFRAVTGLPVEPLPSYASYVLEGNVNLQTQSGIVTRTVYAGPPEAMSDIALPGLSQTVRVTGIRDVGEALRITGVIDAPSQLRRREAATFELEIDRAQGLVRASFRGTPVGLRL
jgi:hypothetical protein